MTTIYCPTRVTVGHKLHMQFVAKIAVAILVLERLFTEYTSHYASYLLILCYVLLNSHKLPTSPKHVGVADCLVFNVINYCDHFQR